MDINRLIDRYGLIDFQQPSHVSPAALPVAAHGDLSAPLHLLLQGSAPTLRRTITTGGVTWTSREGREPRLVSSVGRQVAIELEAKAVATLHCAVCQHWLSTPITLPCGHSLCRAHAQQDADTATCGECGLTGDYVRDFMLQDCIDLLHPANSPHAKGSLPASGGQMISRTVSASMAGQALLSLALNLPQEARLLFCAVCLERFPEPHRPPLLWSCGHTLCSQCTQHIRRKGAQCPLCKSLLEGEPRPSKALRTALGFINALSVARGVADLAQGTQDLHDVQSAVQAFRNEAAVTRHKSLHTAIQLGNLSVVSGILQQGVDCNMLDTTTGHGALHVAVIARQFHLVELLLEAAADPALQSRGGDTAVLFACGSEGTSTSANPGRRKALEAMLQCSHSEGAARLGNASGAMPLHRVAPRLVHVAASPFASAETLEDELVLARLLVEKGADPSAPDFFGMTAVEAVQKSAHPGVRDVFGTYRVSKLADIGEARKVTMGIITEAENHEFAPTLVPSDFLSRTPLSDSMSLHESSSSAQYISAEPVDNACKQQ